MSTPPIDDRAVGPIGMYMVAMELLRAGYHVAVPLVDTGFDLVAIKGQKTWRIQVKATARTGARSNRVRATRGAAKQSVYTSEECDALVAVHVLKRIIVCVTLAQLKGRRWICFQENPCATPFDALQ